MNQRPDFSNATVEDLAANPRKFGCPTFQEFMMMREKYLLSDSGAFGALSDGPQQFRKDLVKIRFQIHGVELNSQEECERALGDHGYSLEDVDLDNRNSRLKKQMEMMPLGGGKYDIVVNFIP